MVTTVPTGPLVGENEVMVGAGGVVTVKSLVLVAVPSGVVTLIGPVVAPHGAVAVICDDESTVKLDGVPLNLTAVAPEKRLPVMVTTVPTGPLVGENEVI